MVKRYKLRKEIKGFIIISLIYLVFYGFLNLYSYRIEKIEEKCNCEVLR